MNDGLIMGMKSFKKFCLIIFIIIILIMFFSTYVTNRYNQNKFEVYLNNKEMRYYYHEDYSNFFLVLASIGGHVLVFTQPNSIDLTNKIELTLNEYEVYNKQGLRRSYDYGNIDPNWEYKKVNNNLKLEIKRMDKTIYKGDYINDLSKYINEKGRYYIHIYSTRKDSLFVSVKTHISFNVIVGGGNRDNKK